MQSSLVAKARLSVIPASVLQTSRSVPINSASAAAPQLGHTICISPHSTPHETPAEYRVLASPRSAPPSHALSGY